MATRTVLFAMDADGTLTGVGRAHAIATARIGEGRVEGWKEIAVRWDESHENEREGEHHASVAKFLLAQKADELVAAGAGPDMRAMLSRMKVKLSFGSGMAKEFAEHMNE